MPVLMLRAAFLALTLFAVLAPAPARAQDGGLPRNLPDPIFVQAPTTAHPSDKAPVYLYFDTDSELCKKHYGESAGYAGCNRELGLTGRKADKGAAISPAIKGEWRWQGDRQLVFTPTETWLAGKNYTIDLDFDTLGVPDNVVIGGGKRHVSVNLRTAGLSFKFSQMKYMQDPDDPQHKLISARLSANYPYDASSLEQHLHFSVEENKDGELKGKPDDSYTITHDNDRKGAWIEVPLKLLPDKEHYGVLLVEKGTAPSDGGENAPYDASERARIPTIDSYLAIQDPSLTVARAEDGTPEQILTFATNVKAAPDKVVPHVKLYLLPAQHPVMKRAEKKSDDIYHWQADSEVTPEILAQSEELLLTPKESGADVTQFSYNVTAPAGRYAYLVIDKDMTAFGGYTLGRPFGQILRMQEWPHDIAIMQEGSILTLSGARKLSLHARGTDRLEIEVAQIRPAALQHFISQTYGDIRSPDFRNWAFGEEDIAEIGNVTLPMSYKSPAESQYTAFDFAPYLKDDRKGLFLLRINGKHGDKDAGAAEQRFVLVTDMGLVVKESRRKTRDVYVMSFAKGTPAAKADVTVLGRNGVPVFSGQTDSDGHVAVPDLSDQGRDREPVAIVAQKDGDYSFIPYEREDRVLNESAFAVGGAVTPAEGLNAFLFTDRGIYRPGETVELGLLVRDAAWTALAPDLPLQLIVTDPRGRTVKDEIIRFPADGLRTAQLTTTEMSATGTYRAMLHIPGEDWPGTLLGSASFKVEDFQPDRLKIKTVFTPAETRGWIKPDGLQAAIGLTNLYGTPATDRRIAGAVTLNPATLSFEGYEDYKFYDAYPAVARTIEYELPDATTDAQGQATMTLDIDKQAEATYSLNLQTRGFEAGSGRGVTAYATALVSPMPYVIGYRTDANLRYLRQGRDYNIDLLALNPDLEGRAVEGLKRELVHRTFVSSLVRRNNGSYAYESVPREETVKTDDFTIADSGSSMSLPADTVGNYTYRLRSADGRIVAAIDFNVAGEGGTPTGKDREAVLDLQINKEKFESGEDIELHITAPYTGAGLITLESDHVIAQKWFKTDKTDTIETIAVPKDFSGKGYVSVSFVRDINSREIYLSPLSHAVMPFIANTTARTTAIELNAPALVPPGEPVTVTYKADRTGKAIIYAVDEGILQVARYKTPDPVDYFLLNRALQVRTAQMLDLLMPEFDLVRALSANGGDAESEGAALGKHLNPFKRKTLAPAVYWSGIVDIGPEERSLAIIPPGHFNGEMRIMAVAVSDDTVGAAESKMIVRGPLVLTPNLPLFMAPGDKATVSLTVANNTGMAGPIGLKAATTPGLVAGEVPGNITIPDGQEKTVNFTVTATNRLGPQTLTVTAETGNITQSAEATLSVRPPVPMETSLVAGYAKKGKADITLSRTMYPDRARRTLAVAPLPTSYIFSLSRYLDEFPYGCTEQIVSKALPRLSLGDRPEFATLRDGSDAAIADTVAQLRLRQTPEGGFSLWDGGRTPDGFASVYALDFLIAAREDGHPVPSRMTEDGLSYLRNWISDDITSQDEATAKAYGIYVLTRSGFVTTNEILHLLRYYDERKIKDWDETLAGLYIAASYKLMQQSDLAERAISRFVSAQKASQISYAPRWFAPWGNPFIRNARMVSLLARHFPDRLENLDQDILFRIAGFISEQRYNTLSASYAIQALADYARVHGEQMKTHTYEVTADRKDIALDSRALTAILPVDTHEIAIRDGGKALFYTVTESGFDRIAPGDTMAQNIEIERHYLDTDGQELAGSIAVGAVLTAEITIRAQGGDAVDNVAIVDLLPGGFDLEQPSDEDLQASSLNPDFITQREDRVIAFGTVTTEPRTVRYRMRAATAGSYIVPPPFAEAMYDVTTKARGHGAQITVTDTP